MTVFPNKNLTKHRCAMVLYQQPLCTVIKKNKKNRDDIYVYKKYKEK